MDKFVYLAWCTSMLGFVFSFILACLLYLCVGVISFTFWDLEPLRLFFSWVAVRLSLVLGFGAAIAFTLSQGKELYQENVPNKDWIKNGKWFS